ncbi:MAG: hypothetical protein AB8A30_04345 [Prochlorococcus sp.]
MKRCTTREALDGFIYTFAKWCCLDPLEECVICCIETSKTGDPLAIRGQRLTQQRLWSSSIPIT